MKSANMKTNAYWDHPDNFVAAALKEKSCFNKHVRNSLNVLTYFIGSS